MFGSKPWQHSRTILKPLSMKSATIDCRSGLNSSISPGRARLDAAMLQSDSRENLAAGAPACAALIEKVRRIAGIHEPSPEAGSSKPSSVHVQQAAGPQFVRHISLLQDLICCCAGQSSASPSRVATDGRALHSRQHGAVPALADIDPERCYVTWEMALATTAGLEAIRDVFIFVEDSCQLSIEPAGDDNVASGRQARG